VIDMMSNAIRFDFFFFFFFFQHKVYILDASVVLSKFVIINSYNILK
jgi:hypothetical protein